MSTWRIEAVGGQYIREQHREAGGTELRATLTAAAAYLGETDVEIDTDSDERTASLYTREAWDSLEPGTGAGREGLDRGGARWRHELLHRQR